MFERDIEGQDIEKYKTFLVTLDNNKLHLSIQNNSVATENKKNIE